MNKILYIISPILLISSCDKGYSGGQEHATSDRLVDASIEITMDDPDIRWVRKDSALVFSATRCCPEPFEASDKGQTVVFNGMKYEGEELIYALCPYYLDASIKGALMNVTIPEEQDGSLSSRLVFGKMEDGRLVSRPIGSMLKFHLPANSGIKSLKVSTPDGLSGDIRIICKKSTIERFDNMGVVRLSGLDSKKAGDYYIMTVPSSSTKLVSIVMNGEKTMTVEVDGICEGITDLGELNYNAAEHPMLFLKKGEESKIEKIIASNWSMKTLHSKILAQADNALKEIPSVYYIPEGGNMLYTCRYALGYIASMSYAYRMTHEQKYLEGVNKELVAVCSFKDWDPSNYLDMGEMATAVCIGYDWLYEYLPESTRKLCEDALVKNALETYTSGKYTSRWWYKVNNNRNQVCCTGLYLAAMVLRNIIPETASRIMADMIESIKVAVDGYDPDGNYMEGAGYWPYGTSYNAILNFAMECDDKTPYYGGNGFKKTSKYYLHMTGPTGQIYNYSDGGSEHDVILAPFYFAQLYKDPSYLWWELQAISRPFTEPNRMITLIMPFVKDLEMSEVQPPKELTWYGKGITPVYITRTSWTDPNASWFGLKGGYSNTSHTHMDGGSFVFESLGERWCIDLGGESYTTLTNNGINQGSMEQNSPRWDVLAYCPSSHSCLRLGDKRMIVNQQATIKSVIDETGRQGVVMNLTPIYYDVNNVTRQACLLGNGVMEIQDAVNPKTDVKYYFTMPTEKSTVATIIDSRTIRLSRNGKYVDVRIKPSDESLVTVPVSRAIKPDNNYERSDARAIDFECVIPASKTTTFTIQIIPKGAEDEKTEGTGRVTDYDREELKW